jgi:hypothetical protein
MVKKHMEKCSTSLSFKEMQIKTKLRFYLTPVRMAIIKNINKNKCSQGCGEKGTLIQCRWECNYTTTMENSMETPQKKK